MKSQDKHIIIGLGVVGLAIYLKRRKPQDELNGVTDSPVLVTPIQSGGASDVPLYCAINYSESAGTENFHISEFHSKDGISVPKSIRGNIQELMGFLEIIRAYFNDAAVYVHSGWRSETHNLTVGGVANSYHRCGIGVDMSISGYSPDEVYDGILELIQLGLIPDGGLGKYNTFTHYDFGPSRRW